MRRRTAAASAALALAGVAMVVAGCGGSNGGSGLPAGKITDLGGGGGGLGGGNLTITVAISGSQTVTGTGSDSAGGDKIINSCADYVSGVHDGGEVDYPFPSLELAPVGGVDLGVEALVENYTGPGTYQVDSIVGRGSPAEIRLGDAYYLLHDGATGQVVLDGNGGGKWTFSNMPNGNNDSSATSDTISGTISWTCKDS